jgi:hypothetical protein
LAQLAAGGIRSVCMLSFQRLDVYQRAIEFLALVYDVVNAYPRGPDGAR